MINKIVISFINFMIRIAFIGKEVHGERLVVSEPTIIVANHNSYFDHFILSYLFNKYNKMNKVYYLTKEEAFDNYFSKKWHEVVQAVPVSRDETGYKGLMTLKQILQDKRASVVVYPEGTRSPTGRMYSGKKGALILAIQTGAPIIPVGIHGTFDILPKNKIWPRLRKADINVGKIIHLTKADKKNIDVIQKKLETDLSLLSRSDFLDKEVPNEANEISTELIIAAKEYNELGIRDYPNNKETPKTYHKRAIYMTNLLIKEKKQVSEAHYEKARAYGRLALNSKFLIYKINYLILAKYLCEKSINADPEYAANYYLMATFHTIAPKLIGGKKSAVKEYFEKAISLDRESLYMKISYSKFLVKQGEYNNAKKLLNRVICSKPNNSVDIRRRYEAEVIMMRIDKNYIPN